MHCKNCHNTLRNTQKFCDECGAKIIQNRLKPKVLAQQVNEQFLCVDNKFLLTFIDLLKKPEAVIIGYINGTRKKYIDVLQYFAISITLVGFQVFLMSTFFKESMDFGSGFIEGFNASSGKTENPFKDIDFNSFNNYQGLIYILTVPFSALGSWLAYYITGDKSYNFTEHIVINLYYSAQVIIITALLTILFLICGLNYFVISSIIYIPTFMYLFYVLKRIFKTTFWDTFARFLLVMAIYIGSFMVIGLLVLIVAIIIGIALHK
ncbi:DUF3667 domain-containing protein [Winogradskyella sp. PC D3.3]